MFLIRPIFSQMHSLPGSALQDSGTQAREPRPKKRHSLFGACADALLFLSGPDVFLSSFLADKPGNYFPQPLPTPQDGE